MDPYSSTALHTYSSSHTAALHFTHTAAQNMHPSPKIIMHRSKTMLQFTIQLSSVQSPVHSKETSIHHQNKQPTTKCISRPRQPYCVAWHPGTRDIKDLINISMSACLFFKSSSCLALSSSCLALAASASWNLFIISSICCC